MFTILFFFKNPFPVVLGFILMAFVEEGIKFLLIKRDIGQYPYGLTLGFGFGIAESVIKWDAGFQPTMRLGAIGLHVITAGVIAYFAKNNRPLLGLVMATIIHSIYNLIVVGVIRFYSI